MNITMNKLKCEQQNRFSYQKMLAGIKRIETSENKEKEDSQK